MTLPDLLSVSRPGVTENGVIAYRITTPIAEDSLPKLMKDVKTVPHLVEAWTEPLPNSKRVALFWTVKGAIENRTLRETFLKNEIRKAVDLILAGTFSVTYPFLETVAVENTKTKTVCTINEKGHLKEERCIQGQRCGYCKHLCLAIIRGDLRDEEIEDLYFSMQGRGEVRL